MFGPVVPPRPAPCSVTGGGDPTSVAPDVSVHLLAAVAALGERALRDAGRAVARARDARRYGIRAVDYRAHAYALERNMAGAGGPTVPRAAGLSRAAAESRLVAEALEVMERGEKA